MEEFIAELLKLAKKCKAASAPIDDPEFDRILKALGQSAERVGRASGGSWAGHLSRVYYEDFEEPPPGNHFNSRWPGSSEGNWAEYRFEDVISAIEELAGNPEQASLREAVKHARAIFKESKADILSVLDAVLEATPSTGLREIKEKIRELGSHTPAETVAKLRMPRQMIVGADVVNEGIQPPPHLTVQFQLVEQRSSLHNVGELGDLALNAAKFIERTQKMAGQDRPLGKKVFLGHGRGKAWLELRVFLVESLGLQIEEFNVISPAGKSHKERLLEMLDNSRFAFLIMTAEDEHADGSKHPRENVIHEAGLFQGRLGFEKAIVVLEETCEEFSNIHGLGHIRFPKGNIAAAYEDVRKVLTREEII